MFKINKIKYLKEVVISSLISFISVNVYWLLTITYTFPVKRSGESGVLIGFEAAHYLIKLKGMSVYLHGMSWFYVVALSSCLIGTFIYKKKNDKLILNVSLLSLLCAVIYYIFSVAIYITNVVEGVKYKLTGLDALMAKSFMQSFYSVLGLWLILFFTVFIAVKLTSRN